MAAAKDTATEMQKHMQFVAERICLNWKQLAIQLGIESHVIDGADANFTRVEDKAFEILSKWYKACGQAATIETLIKALITIGEKAIAEKLEIKMGWKHKVEREPTRPIKETREDHKSTEESGKSPKGYKMTFEKLDKELEKMFKNCIGNCAANVEIWNCSALLHNQKMLQHVQNMNTILKESIELHENSDEDGTSLKEMHKSFRNREQQTEETILFIQGRIQDPGMNNKVPINPKKGKDKKPRPASEIPPRCTSEVDLQKLVRSKTDDSPLIKDKRRISSPILTIRHSVLCRESSPPVPTYEEESRVTEDEVFAEMPQLTALCKLCGNPCMSNLQAEKLASPGSASEHEQASLDENCNQESAGTDDLKEEQVSLDQNCNQVSKPAPENPEIDEKETKNTRL